MQDGIYQIKGKFTRARLVYADNKVNTAKIWVLSAEYQSSINNASLETEMQSRQLNLEILIQELRRMCEIRSIGKGTQSDIEMSSEVDLSVSDKRISFKCGQTWHVKIDCLEKDSKDYLNDKESATFVSIMWKERPWSWNLLGKPRECKEMPKRIQTQTR